MAFKISNALLKFYRNQAQKKEKERAIEKAEEHNATIRFLEMPYDCLYQILSFLLIHDVVQSSLICKDWYYAYHTMPDDYWRYFTKYCTSKSEFKNFVCNVDANKCNVGAHKWKGFFQKSYYSFITKIYLMKNSTFFVRGKTIYVCGDNENGQLGVGNTNAILTPTKMNLNLKKDEIIENFICGNDSIFIQTNKNNIYVCGHNWYGQLGVGNANNILIPTKMDLNLEKGESIKNVIYKDHTVFIQTNKNNIYVCGYNVCGQCGVGHANDILTPAKMNLKLEKYESIKNVIYKDHTVFIRTNKGNIYVCGRNWNGQLGVGHANDILTPTKMDLNLEKDESIKNVICKNSSTFIQTNKYIYVCGYGQCGVGYTNKGLIPTKMDLTLEKDESIKNVIYKDHTVFIQTNKNNIYVCGYNGDGRCGVGHTDKILIPTKMNLKLEKDEIIINIIYKNDSTFIQTNKYIYVCGYNGDGRCGVGHTDKILLPEKMKLKLEKDESIINVIYKDHTVFIRTNKNNIYACGCNRNGQLGVGHANNILIPTKMNLKLEKDEIIENVICEKDSTLIQTNKGNIYVCGLNWNGHLGVGHADKILTPTKMNLNLENDESIINVVCKNRVAFIQTNKNNIYVCGDNRNDQLGVGDTNNILTPINKGNICIFGDNRDNKFGIVLERKGIMILGEKVKSPTVIKIPFGEEKKENNKPCVVM